MVHRNYTIPTIYREKKNENKMILSLAVKKAKKEKILNDEYGILVHIFRFFRGGDCSVGFEEKKMPLVNRHNGFDINTQHTREDGVQMVLSNTQSS